MSHIWIVDDEESICWGLKRLLGDAGHRVTVCASAEAALAQCEKSSPDLIVLDVRLPGMDGLTAMQHLRERVGEVPIVVITAFGNLDVAVTAMRNGAFDYLAKPFDLEQAASVIDRALDHGRPAPPAARSFVEPVREDLLGAGPAMQEVFKRIALVAPSEASVLIVGESGTGKELVARAIHRHSLRADRAFVPIHLAALSPTLVESELFGHERGSFTGAETTRSGLLELANDSTVFFDEAGDIPPAVQVKLLRVLEQREVTPVGSARPRPTSFRVIAATHRPLHGEQGEGALRRDLYFRLAAFEIHLPALRDRVEDIPLLAEAFLRRAEQGTGTVVQISTSAMDELCRRPWPGNVRQLRHAIEHGRLLARGGTIEIEHLPPPEPVVASGDQGALDLAVRRWTQAQLSDDRAHGHIYQQFLARVEPSLFETVLSRTTGNRAAAADALGIHRATLRKKLAGGNEEA